MLARRHRNRRLFKTAAWPSTICAYSIIHSHAHAHAHTHTHTHTGQAFLKIPLVIHLSNLDRSFQTGIPEGQTVYGLCPIYNIDMADYYNTTKNKAIPLIILGI